MTRQKAIDVKCRECIFDELADGTWRVQVEQCELTGCGLYPYRLIGSKFLLAITMMSYTPYRSGFIQQTGNQYTKFTVTGNV
jgi:hypothetical protein